MSFLKVDPNPNSNPSSFPPRRPLLQTMAWDLVKGFLNERPRNKVAFLNRAESLLEHIDEDQFPPNVLPPAEARVPLPSLPSAAAVDEKVKGPEGVGEMGAEVKEPPAVLADA